LTISAIDQSVDARNMRSKMGIVLLMGIGLRLFFLFFSGDLLFPVRGSRIVIVAGCQQ